jgi:peptide deformylase
MSTYTLMSEGVALLGIEDVVLAPDLRLRQVLSGDKNTHLAEIEAARIMHSSLEVLNGVGLAANQVGLLTRFFVADLDEGENTLFFNPQIVAMSSYTESEIEGCLSLPGLRVEVARPWWVSLGFIDEWGKLCSRTYEDYDARIVFHEMDHLDGLLITNRFSIDRTTIRRVSWKS